MAYSYVATAYDWRGHETGHWKAATVASAMAKADEHAHPANRIDVRAAFTSDGTFWGEGRGRMMAYSDGKASKGRRSWRVESYRDRLTEESSTASRDRGSKRRRANTVRSRRR